MMFFKRKPKNRRLGREFVLDVKLRSSQVRSRRMRIAAVMLSGVIGAVACIFLGWRATELALNVLLYQNDAFAITSLDVQSDGVIAPEQLRRWTGVRLGQNLLALDMAVVNRNLSMVSAIKSVSIEKIKPHCLRIRVVEREPLAQISVVRPKSDGGVEPASYFLDAEGYVIVPLDATQCAGGLSSAAFEQLPAIIGFNPADVRPGRRMDSPQIQAALELIQAFQRSSIQNSVELKKIDVGASDVLVARTSQGAEITFSPFNMDQQLLRWQAIADYAFKENKAIASLDLAVSNSIPATWADAGSLLQVPLKSNKPQRYRKKHV